MRGLLSEAIEAGRRILGDTARQARFARIVRAHLAAPAPHVVELEDGSGRGATYHLFFALGYGKSGTNWLGAVLNLHPEVWCAGEFHLQVFARALREFTDPPYSVGSREPYRAVAEEGVRDLMRRLLMAGAAERPQARWLGARGPRPFEVLLEQAPHIYIVRDGRDVAVSWTYHHLRKRRPENLWWWPDEMRRSLHEAGRRFDQSDEAAREAARALLADEEWVRFVVGAWARQVRQDLAAIDAARERGTPVHIVRYEELHGDIERARQRMYAFLGLDPGRARPVSAETATAPGFAVERPRDFRRRGTVGDWRGYPDTIGRVFDAVAADLAGFAGGCEGPPETSRDAEPAATTP
jgi:hypothetical protein